MASVTPVLSLPANGITSGAVQITSTGVRISARSTSGTVGLVVIRMDGVSGNWFRYTDPSGDQLQLTLSPAGANNGATDYSYTLPAVAANEYYHLLLENGTTFTGVAEIENAAAPPAAGGTVPSSRTLTMGSGLLIGGGASADLSSDRTIAIDSAMATLSATALTLKASVDLLGTAGDGAVDLSMNTGNCSLPTGALAWAGAAGKNLSLVGLTTGTVTIDNAAAWSIGATGGLTGTLGRTGQTLSLPGVVTCTGVLSPPTVANGAVQGGVPVVFRQTLTSGANGDTDITVTPKVRVIDAWLVMKGGGTAGCLVTIKNTASAITEALDVAASIDKALVRFASIDDATQEISAGGILRISKASTGADFPGAEVYVTCLHVA